MSKYMSPITLFAFWTVLATVCLNGNPAAAAPREVPGRVLVSFEPGQKIQVDKASGQPRTGLAPLDAVLQAHTVIHLEPLFGDMIDAMKDPAVREDLARHYLVRHADKAGNGALIADFKALNMVQDAESDLEFPAHGTAFLPDDLAGAQWYLRNQALGDADIRAVGGWSESLGDTNVVVAVCDSGVDWHHPDLGGTHPDKVTGAMWTNWVEYYGTTGVDDDSNGKIDDIRGWDFVDLPMSSVYPGEDGPNQDNDPMDFGGHGTLVSGCIAPITDNGIGIAGTAPGCKIMAVRIGYQGADGNGYSYASLMAQGFLYAAANGANIVNLSYGTGYTSAFASAINATLNSGLIICTSAGNDDSQESGYLGGLTDDRILAVAATSTSDTKASFSNYGDWVDLGAPGASIYTTAYDAVLDESTYGTTQGTSFSSPIVAGGCALIWSANPTWTSAQVAALVQSSCDNIDAQNPDYIGMLGAGRMNLLKALGDNVHKYPLEFPTLQDIMNSAAQGDTIKIAADHTIAGTMTVVAKGLQVLGAYDATYTTRDPVGAKTPINATGTSTGLRFYGSPGAATIVDGFAISGGGGVFYAGIPYGAKYGGGVILNNASPTLRNLDVTGNSVGSSSQLGCGGGLMMNGSNSLLENVEIHGNSAIYGAGLFAFESAATLVGCRIYDNLPQLDNLTYPPSGGGVHILDSDLTMIDCEISGHEGVKNGGGVYAAGYNTVSNLDITGGLVTGNTAELAGGGVYVNGGSADLIRVSVVNNARSPAASFMHGGGVYAVSATVSLDSLDCRNNDAHLGGGVVLNSCPQADVANSLFISNNGLFWAGALAYDTNAAGTVSGNTFVLNTGTAGGAGLYLTGSSPTVVSNISAFNSGGTSYGNGMALISAPSSLTCNDVYGNIGGDYSGQPDPTGTNGNISVDPEFCDPGQENYNVQTTSPCDADNSGGCGLIGALGDGCGVSPVIDESQGVPAAFRVEQSYPNPFNPKTTIRFALPVSGRTSVTVFDVAGRLVRTLLDEDLAASVHEVTWTGDDDQGRRVAAGVYFYMVASGDNHSVGRMALVK